MSDLEALHLAPPVAARLARAGWTADDARVRAAAPVAARGNNLVVAAPPSPAWSLPALAGLLSHRLGATPGLCLMVAPAEAVDEWARLVGLLALGSALRLAAARTPGRLTRVLRSDAVDVLVTSPENAEELIRRAALKMERAAALALAWPECWPEPEALARLFADLPETAQRLLITTDPAETKSLVERYVWRAPVADLLGEAPSETAPAVQTTPVSWARRRQALSELFETLDPATCAIWTAGSLDHEAIRAGLACAGAAAQITDGTPDPAALVIAYDLPAPAMLRRLGALGETLLLVPPAAEAYTARLAPRRRPVHLPGAMDRARTDLEGARREVASRLEAGPDAAAFHGVAPLLERYEAPAVAAALWQLWRARPAEPAAARAAAPGASAVRLWIGAGTRDDVAAGDVMAALVRYGGVTREAVGKIEIRESFSLVELGHGVDAEVVAEKVTGRMIGKRRLVARVDRGRPAGRQRPGMPPRPPR